MNQMFLVKVFIKAVSRSHELMNQMFSVKVFIKAVSRCHELMNQMFSVKVFIKGSISWSRAYESNAFG